MRNTSKSWRVCGTLVLVVSSFGCGDDPTESATGGGVTGNAGAGGVYSAGAGGTANSGAGGSVAGGNGGWTTSGTGGTGIGGTGGSSIGGAGGAGTGGTGGTSTGGSGGTSTGGSGGTGTGTGGSGGGAALICDELPAPTGQVISVNPTQAAQLPSIVAGAPSGSTIELANGTYLLGSALKLSTPGVSLRSASNDPQTVIIDGQYSVAETVVITASNVTIAHVTVTHAIDHPIHIYPPGPGINVTGTLIYGVRIVDGGEQFIKANPIVGQDGYVDDAVVECSSFELTNAGRPYIEPCCGGCYTGGIDVHGGWNWIVRHNEFHGIYCDNGGLAEHAIHFWRSSRGTLVENNKITNCARGIGFGLENGTGQRVYPDSPHGGMDLAHYDGIIRNNVIYADLPWYDTGIELADTREPLIYHNTVVSNSSASGFYSSIDYRFPQTSVVIRNHLTRKITQRNNAVGTVDHNLQATPLSYFMNLPTNFHLEPTATQAIDQGLSVADAGLDIDAQPHTYGTAPDLGADEFVP